MIRTDWVAEGTSLPAGAQPDFGISTTPRAPD
jgi:hypothetical protein